MSKQTSKRQRKEGGKWIKQNMRLAIYIRDDFSCVYCGSQENLSLDHVTPYSKGGGDKHNNLVTSCCSCNSRRGNKSIFDFATLDTCKAILERITKNIHPFNNIAVKQIKLHGGYTKAKNAMIEGLH